MFRTLTAYLLAPVLALTGYRFSKDYRNGISSFHRLVYGLVSTPKANIVADGMVSS